MRQELKEGLERMDELGIIDRVSQPTNRVNALAFCRKQNGKLLVCLDPKDLNKTIKRTYHKTPTLEIHRSKILFKNGCSTWLLGHSPG